MALQLRYSNGTSFISSTQSNARPYQDFISPYRRRLYSGSGAFRTWYGTDSKTNIPVQPGVALVLELEVVAVLPTSLPDSLGNSGTTAACPASAKDHY